MTNEFPSSQPLCLYCTCRSRRKQPKAGGKMPRPFLDKASCCCLSLPLLPLLLLLSLLLPLLPGAPSRAFITVSCVDRSCDRQETMRTRETYKKGFCCPFFDSEKSTYFVHLYCELNFLISGPWPLLNNVNITEGH